MAICSGFTHCKWWFSTLMLVYQRVNHCWYRWIIPTGNYNLYLRSTVPSFPRAYGSIWNCKSISRKGNGPQTIRPLIEPRFPPQKLGSSLSHEPTASHTSHKLGYTTWDRDSTMIQTIICIINPYSIINPYINPCHLSYSIYHWLVVWNIFIFPYIGNVIIPTDELIFFRGV